MTPNKEKRKQLGQFFTPENVARTLVLWVIKRETDQLLDPSCGDGQFLACHPSSTGIEVDCINAALARDRVPAASVLESDFFQWASHTPLRFEAAAGNPPFIRYQHFVGETRQLAMELAEKLGARINGLASAWVPFLVVTAGLLKPNGRMAFVVPAEIGHAPYASPLLTFLCSNFHQVRIVAIREKLFPELSEAAWLLFADGFGGRTSAIELSLFEKFDSFIWTARPNREVTVSSWQAAGCRLRKFILSEDALALYQFAASKTGVFRLGDVAGTSIGYVSGANDFFHLRPSEIKRNHIPRHFVRVAVRRSRQLPADCVDQKTVKNWLSKDEPVMLLDIADRSRLPSEVISYLDSERGREVRNGYKCRNRDPWYTIPDIRVPDAFLSYMSSRRPVLVRNEARCVCTNSVHGVFLKGKVPLAAIQHAWSHPLVDLSCELEGHPLGGGLLKLEPREASNVLLPFDSRQFSPSDVLLLEEAVSKIRKWRCYG